MIIEKQIIPVVPVVILLTSGNGNKVKMNNKNINKETVSEALCASDTVTKDKEILKTTLQQEKIQFELNKQFTDFFREAPFPLTAEKLARFTQQYDFNMTQLSGVFYLKRLYSECALLLPRPINGHCILEWNTVLITWTENQNYFLCKTIGEILKIYQNLYREIFYVHQEK